MMSTEDATRSQPAISNAAGSFEAGARAIIATPAKTRNPCSVNWRRQFDRRKFALIFSNS